MSTRPMMDIVKGSLFNMLETMDGIGDRVLDLFAGSGSLGIEGLSRGAEHADFVEQNREACKVIAENLKRLGFAEQARVITSRAEDFVSTIRHDHIPTQFAGPTQDANAVTNASYDLVFIDAPYVDKASLKILTLLATGIWLNDDALVCIGHHKHEDLPDQFETLRRVKHRCFGASCLSIYQYQNTKIV